MRVARAFGGCLIAHDPACACRHLLPTGSVEPSCSARLPVSLPTKLRVTTAETEHMPFYLRVFLRVLSSWVHHLTRRNAPDRPVEGAVLGPVWGQRLPTRPEQLIGGIGGRASHRRDDGRVDVHRDRDGAVSEPFGDGLRVDARHLRRHRSRDNGGTRRRVLVTGLSAAAGRTRTGTAPRSWPCD